MNNGLVQSLNAIRETSSEIYHKYIPVLDETSDISMLSNPIFTYPEVYNEFQSALMNRLVYSQYLAKTFRNPLKGLEGDNLPFGYAGREVYTNPAKGRGYNPNDFAGLLVKYEADVKVSYHTINADLQYPVTFSRQELKKAMTSWGELESFIEGLSNSLYNGAYIDEFRMTKDIVAGAYKDNKAIIESITAVTDEDTAKAFVERAREMFLNFQLPSSQYNAWAKCGGEGRPVVTWTNPDDIVFIIKNSLRAKLDVEVLANAFNMDKTTLLGNIIAVDNFDEYNEEGEKIFDGSAIVGIMADRNWFKIKTQDMFMDEFYNPNNRSTQFYLNVIKMYNFSLFANGVIFATALPEGVPYTSLSYGDTTEVEVLVDDTEGLELIGIPGYANAEITYTSGSTSIFTVEAKSGNDRECVVTGVSSGTATLTASTGTGSNVKTASLTIKVVTE